MSILQQLVEQVVCPLRPQKAHDNDFGSNIQDPNHENLCRNNADLNSNDDQWHVEIPKSPRENHDPKRKKRGIQRG